MPKKKRSRFRSRPSPDAGPLEPPSGELPSPGRSGEPASSDRSGEGGSSSAAAASGREGKQRTQAGERPPSPVEETAVRPKQRRKKEKRRLPGPPGPPDRPGHMDHVTKGDALQWRRPGEHVTKGDALQWRRPGEPASSDRSGEGASAAAAAADRDWKQRTQAGGRSPYPVEETAMRPKQWRMKKKQRNPCTNLPVAEHTLLLEEAHIKKKAYIDDANLVMQKSVMPPSHSSSVSGEAQEETSIDGEGASSPLSVEKQPKPTSVDHGKVAHDEDEDDDGHSVKKSSSVALSEVIAQDGDGQHFDKIGDHAIEDPKQGLGRASEHVQALLDLDDDTIVEKIFYWHKQLKYDPPEPHDCCPAYDEEKLAELNERLALYRIKGYELTVHGKLAELDDANLKLQYPPPKLHSEGFFKYYEEELDWYFDPKRCRNGYYDDYQRLMLFNELVYVDWHRYISFRNTYVEDLAYVKYCEMIANELKWIEDYLDKDSTHLWKKVNDVAYIQALEIGAGFCNVSHILIFNGFQEYLRSFMFDHSHKGLDGVYFEIWKRVAKGKMDFREALLEVQREDMFPLRSSDIKNELEGTPWRFALKDFVDPLLNFRSSSQFYYFIYFILWRMLFHLSIHPLVYFMQYYAFVAGIGGENTEDQARQLVREAVKKMKPKYYLDYVKAKLDIANDIGLVPKGSRPEVTPERNGDDGGAKVEMN